MFNIFKKMAEVCVGALVKFALKQVQDRVLGWAKTYFNVPRASQTA